MENQKCKKQLIICAATKIFARHGFHNAKVSSIAAEAGIGKGTIYEYFDSKKQLFIEMIKYHADNYLQALLKSIQSQNNFYDKLYCYMIFEKKHAETHQNIGRIFEATYSIGTEINMILYDIRRKKIEMLSHIIEEGIQKNFFRRIPSYEAALVLIGISLQLGTESILAKNNAKNPIDIHHLLEILLNGIKKDRD